METLLKITLALICSCFAAGAKSQITDGQLKESYQSNFKFAQELDVNKSFPTNNQTVLELDNQFGFIKVEHWDKNEINFQAKITAKANKADMVEQILDNIKVDEQVSGNRVSIKTKIDNKGNYYKGKNISYRSTMSIDYTVKLPKYISLKIENMFGDIYLQNHNGAVDIVSKFGKLFAEQLSSKSNIVVEYGKAYLKNLSLKYLDAKYSDIEIQEVKDNLIAKLEFCNTTEITLPSDIKKVDIKAEFSKVNLIIPKNLNADLTAEINNGDLTNKAQNIAVEKEKSSDKDIYGYDPIKRYRAKIGKGGDCTIKLKGNFSSFKLK